MTNPAKHPDALCPYCGNNDPVKFTRHDGDCMVCDAPKVQPDEYVVPPPWEEEGSGENENAEAKHKNERLREPVIQKAKPAIEKIRLLPVNSIDPSPYQQRQYFGKTALQELGRSIEREGLLQPIVVRKKESRYELIAGERRWRAVKHHTSHENIIARVIAADDLQSRRMCAAENMQRDDLSAVEEVHAIVEMVDAELIEDFEYGGMGETPVERVGKLLKQMASASNSRSRGSTPRQDGKQLLNNFVQQVERIFANLPKPKKWHAFCNHDLPLLSQLEDEEVKGIATANKLNKAQAKALAKLKKKAPSRYAKLKREEEDKVTVKAKLVGGEGNDSVPLRECSANEIEDIADPDAAWLRRAKNIKKGRAEERWEQRTQDMAAAVAAAHPLEGKGYKLIEGDLLKACKSIVDESVDAIITDPPYPVEYLPLYESLSTLADRVLKPGGHCLVMVGQSHLPKLYQLLTTKLTYQWTLNYYTPGESTQVFGRHIKSNWKPVIWLIKGQLDWEHVDDTVRSDMNDKRFHEWGQSVGGMAQIIKRFTVKKSLILDPFCGAGTTGVAAISLDRLFVGVDIDGERIAQSAERLQAVSNPKKATHGNKASQV